MKVISLGWGVQSFTLAAMSVLGEIERVDATIHADTLHESSLTYEFAERWTSWLECDGMRVVTVKNPVDWYEKLEIGQVFIPAFTLSEKGRKGNLLRSCTQRWKIAPLRRWLQANRNGEQVEQWLGISTDEALRMKPSNVGYVTHRWPLIEMNMSRQDCIDWLKAHDIEVPPRSSCTFCPYHDTNEWRRTKDNTLDWGEAVEADRKIRDIRPKFRSFIHASRTPIDKVDFRTQEEKGQISLWDDECVGVCGV